MLLWWVEVSRHRSWNGVTIPLWIPFILVTIPTVVLWYQDRRCIPTVINRWARRLRPRQRKKVTFWSVLVFCVIHVAATLVAVVMLVQAIPFFFSPQSAVGEFLNATVSWGAPIFFFGTPLWALLWAWVYARLLNSLMRKLPTPFCPECGYDLTGNTSGICPECGQPITTQEQGDRPAALS